ncbi:MAG: tetraacyldisaccharide 4'-kinase, partial [Bacteroidota bacterium]
HIAKETQLLQHLKYGDHHRYTKKEVLEMKSLKVSRGTIYLTTEKDFVKLREFEQELRDLPLYYVPIEIKFRNNKSEFDELVLQSIKTYKTPDGEND